MTIIDELLSGFRAIPDRLAALSTDYTPDPIAHLEPNEVMVFGSNREGIHAGGAARAAYDRFGAIWGKGEGHHGSTYALPTMGSLHETEIAAQKFIAYAKQHPEFRFLLTHVGCGIAGRTPEEIAPLFTGSPSNVIMPQAFAAVIQGENQ